MALEIKILSILKHENPQSSSSSMQELIETECFQGEHINHTNRLKSVVQPPNSTWFLPPLLLSTPLSLGILQEACLSGQCSQHKSRLVGEHLQLSKREKKFYLTLEAQNRADKNNGEVKYGNGRRFCWLKREYFKIFFGTVKWCRVLERWLEGNWEESEVWWLTHFLKAAIQLPALSKAL